MSSTSMKTDAQLRIVGVTIVGVVLGCIVLAFLRAVLGWSVWAVTATAVAAALLAGGVGAATFRWWGQTPAMRALRNTSALDDVMGKSAISKGAQLRGIDTETTTVTATQVAMQIGKIGREPVYKTLEDFGLVIMGPRSNKTSSQAVPRILSALGSVVATSNKPDLWILTAELRRQHGPVYGYDPGSIGFVEQTWWWNILRDIVDFKSAKRVATHFMAGVGINNAESGNSGFFNSGSKQMLARCLLAAAVSGKTMRDVIRWIDTYSREPVELLTDHGHKPAGLALDGQLDLPHETLGGIQGGASSALECLQDESALRWVTPPDTWDDPGEGIEELDLWTLFTAEPGNAPSLYLMTQEGAESSGPVVAAIVDAIFKLADLASSAQGGRIDPPMSVVLDEAANICRIDDLPAKASHVGSKGIAVDVILQSYQQGMGVWGREKMGALWSASTCRIIGAGLQDRDDARMISDLVGTHEVWKDSYSYSGGTRSRTRSLTREPIMPLEEVAALDRGHALLVRQGSKPVLMQLLPWYREDDADEISGYASRATAEVRSSAIHALRGTALGEHLAVGTKAAPA